MNSKSFRSRPDNTRAPKAMDQTPRLAARAPLPALVIAERYVRAIPIRFGMTRKEEVFGLNERIRELEKENGLLRKELDSLKTFPPLAQGLKGEILVARLRALYLRDTRTARCRG